ncbi:hypothetical protein BD289DRAFT_484565 [Coniella lustricola]|uniref:Conjugal transfer protein n=1 Tax=Coniella lustricola TaxID=2025994 RepID=A0A2T3A1F1_9PEZI|nr:hypothetical protein BD289DRAFT_484565 [Coniella lustricola]
MRTADIMSTCLATMVMAASTVHAAPAFNEQRSPQLAGIVDGISDALKVSKGLSKGVTSGGDGTTFVPNSSGGVTAMIGSGDIKRSPQLAGIVDGISDALKVSKGLSKGVTSGGDGTTFVPNSSGGVTAVIGSGDI